MQTHQPSSAVRQHIVGFVIATIAFAGLLSLEACFQPISIKGLYFQNWSSERMMQTVSIEDLRNEPIRSLWHLHIQPPGFDTLRAMLAYIVGSDNAEVTLWRVDHCLYFLWALIYGMIVFIVFQWLSDITSIVFAACAALLFAAHPALIFYATLLDTTLLSTFLVLLFCYLLWRVREGRCDSAVLLAISFLSMYFTRSIFQWHWIFLLSFCLFLLRFPWNKVLLFFAITSSVVGLYTAKQMFLFDISSTSSFTGLNLCNSIGYDHAWEYYRRATAPVEAALGDSPRVLNRVRKLNGSINFNNAHYLKVNRRLQEDYRRQLRSKSIHEIALHVLENARIYFQPSSRYTPHIIVDSVPWRSQYDYVVSYPSLPVLVGLSFVFWLWRAHKTTYLPTVGLCLPVVLIAVICVLFERGENMRFKMFIEPILFCFVGAQIYAAGKHVIGAMGNSTTVVADVPRE